VILGLKIGVGIVLGIVGIHLAFWACLIIVYGAIWLLEAMLKTIVKLLK
jgi:hypothetical protein